MDATSFLHLFSGCPLHRYPRHRRSDTSVWKLGLVRTSPVRCGCFDILAAKHLHCFLVFFAPSIAHAVTDGFGTALFWIDGPLARVGFRQFFSAQYAASGSVPLGFKRLLLQFHFTTQIRLICAFTQLFQMGKSRKFEADIHQKCLYRLRIGTVLLFVICRAVIVSVHLIHSPHALRV
jgi:hypothetical protein